MGVLKGDLNWLKLGNYSMIILIIAVAILAAHIKDRRDNKSRRFF